MSTLKLVVVLVGALFLSACDVVSLSPLYDDDTLTLVPELVGSWRIDTDETWTFTSAGKKMYSLVIKEVERDGRDQEPQVKVTRAEVGLVRLSGKLFMDVMSEDSGMTGAPAHIFARIEVDQDVLRAGLVNDSWMKDMLKIDTYVRSVPAAHGKTVLTSPTRDLQSFFRDHAWDEEAYLHGKGDGHEDPNTFFQRIR